MLTEKIAKELKELGIKHIFVVDDLTSNWMTAAKYLSKLEKQYCIKWDCADRKDVAIEKIKQSRKKGHAYDLVLTDLDMALAGEGLEVAEQAYKHYAIPFIVTGRMRPLREGEKRGHAPQWDLERKTLGKTRILPLPGEEQIVEGSKDQEKTWEELLSKATQYLKSDEGEQIIKKLGSYKAQFKNQPLEDSTIIRSLMEKYII